LDKWFNKNLEEVVENLNVNTNNGLDEEEAKKRQEEHGLNELEEQEGRSLLSMIAGQFKDFLIIVLLAAALVSGFVGELKDAILIVAIVIVNAIMGVVQENKAEQSLAALKKLSTPTAKVIRDGSTQEIPAQELVPGDIILLDAGDYIPADGRLVEAASLKIQESALTGESVPVGKHTKKIDKEEVPLGDRKNLVYMSSVVTYGRGKAIVSKTGMNTEIGKIADMIQKSETVQTPLQKRLEELGKLLGIGALIICGLMFLVGVLQGRETFGMFLTAVSLAVAAIPEGLPAIVTVVLALGVQRMINKNAIIRKLPAVETLGSASVICSDKTGTLTQNKMTIKEIYVDENRLGIRNWVAFK
jgi:P-type Ca2+ transporter type 2C